MNQNVNEPESFAGDYVASGEGRLFLEVPISVEFAGPLWVPAKLSLASLGGFNPLYPDALPLRHCHTMIFGLILRSKASPEDHDNALSGFAFDSVFFDHRIPLSLPVPPE